MKHFVLGYAHPSRKGAVTVLYAGDSRADARAAMFAGGEGIVVTDYICNPQVSQSKRFSAVIAEAAPAPEPKPAPKAEAKAKAEAEPKADAKPLALPPQSPAPSQTPPDSEA
jgi:phosphoglycolate phosphatase-like HAD superfamily hydrolase